MSGGAHNAAVVTESDTSRAAYDETGEQMLAVDVHMDSYTDALRIDSSTKPLNSTTPETRNRKPTGLFVSNSYFLITLLLQTVN